MFMFVSMLFLLAGADRIGGTPNATSSECPQTFYFCVFLFSFRFIFLRTPFLRFYFYCIAALLRCVCLRSVLFTCGFIFLRTPFFCRGRLPDAAAEPLPRLVAEPPQQGLVVLCMYVYIYIYV